MKVRKIYWLPLAGAVAICWCQPVVQPPPQARIKVESDGTDIPDATARESGNSFDLSYVHGNYISELFTQPKNSHSK